MKIRWSTECLIFKFLELLFINRNKKRDPKWLGFKTFQGIRTMKRKMCLSLKRSKENSLFRKKKDMSINSSILTAKKAKSAFRNEFWTTRRNWSRVLISKDFIKRNRQKRLILPTNISLSILLLVIKVTLYSDFTSLKSLRII